MENNATAGMCEQCAGGGLEREGTYSTTFRRVLCWVCLMKAMGEKTRRELSERSREYPIPEGVRR